MKPTPYWTRSFSSELESDRLLMLHRVTDMEAEDELMSITSLDLLAVAFGLVFGIGVSIFKPWQWFA